MNLFEERPAPHDGGPSDSEFQVHATRIAVRAGLRFVHLSIAADDPLPQRRLEAAIGRPLPMAAGPAEGAVHPTVLWRASRRWLALLPYAEARGVRRWFAETDPAFRIHAVDWSDQLRPIDMEGPQAAAILQRGTPQDLGESAFPILSSRQLVLAQVRVHLFRQSPQAWLLLVQRSLAHYLCAWVRHVSRADV